MRGKLEHIAAVLDVFFRSTHCEEVRHLGTGTTLLNSHPYTSVLFRRLVSALYDLSWCTSLPSLQ